MEIIMNTYKLTKSIFKSEQRKYYGYGIAFYDCGCINIIVRNISPDRSFVEEIIRKCCSGSAAPEHVKDIVYDSLA